MLRGAYASLDRAGRNAERLGGLFRAEALDDTKHEHGAEGVGKRGDCDLDHSPQLVAGERFIGRRRLAVIVDYRYSFGLERPPEPS